MIRRWTETVQAVAPTWGAMIQIEPRLGDLAIWARSQRRLRGRHRWLAYERCNSMLRPLCGWWASDDRLGTSAHWDAALSVLIRELRI